MKRKAVQREEVLRRTEQYYNPITQQTQAARYIKMSLESSVMGMSPPVKVSRQLIKKFRSDIRRCDGTAASAQAWLTLAQLPQASRYEVSHNHPFIHSGYTSPASSVIQKTTNTLHSWRWPRSIMYGRFGNEIWWAACKRNGPLLQKHSVPGAGKYVWNRILDANGQETKFQTIVEKCTYAS